MTTHHDGAARRTAAYSSIAFVAAFVSLLIVLHFLEPKFDPPHFISEYELGRFGWLMSLAFFCLGIGSLCLLLALWSDLQTKGGRIGCWLLLLVSIAYIGAGVFAPDPSSIAESRLHGLSGIVVIFSSPVAFTLLWRSLIRDPHWFEVSRLLKWMTLIDLARSTIVLRFHHHFLWTGAWVWHHRNWLDKQIYDRDLLCLAHDCSVAGHQGRYSASDQQISLTEDHSD
jgi:hypothetical membrane protein